MINNESEVISGTPSLTEFDPSIIPYQLKVINQVRGFDYSKGVLEILLSGSFGSAKSLLMAHIGITHVMLNKRARLCLCRRAMPDLKDTIYRKILDHMEGVLIEGVHYEKNDNRASIQYYNGSSIMSRSWHDKNYKKFRSIELTAALIEEVTENSTIEFAAFYKELFARVGRIPGIKENFIIGATNPDAPSHSAYEYFILSKNPNRKVFYSRTDENPFLPKTYIEQIKAGLTQQEIRRYIWGEWVEIKSEVVYYAYDADKSAVLKDYKVNLKKPIYISYDFNIGDGKPMSLCLSQYIDGNFYFFDEIVIFSARTLDTLEELNARGWLDYPCQYIIHGDATGKRRDTRSIHSDYEIITTFLANLRNKFGDINFMVDVPVSNPPVRQRHSLVNGQLKNSYGIVSVYLDPVKCKMLDKGFRLTKLKKGGAYIEDDSDPWQHITTSAGYHICRILRESNHTPFVKSKFN